MQDATSVDPKSLAPPGPASIHGDYPLPFPVQFKGSALARWVLRLFGWRVNFLGLPARQGVIVVYPHTSNWDFPVGILAKWTIGLPVQFWGKDSLFKVPVFGRWLRWVGGIPVVRSAANGLVDQAVADLQRARQHDEYRWVALAPEGTRKRTEGWRSGFYQTVFRAGVPLGIAHLDYASRTVHLAEFMSLTGRADDDMARLALVYQSTRGKKHHDAAPVVLLPARTPAQPKLPHDT